MVTPELQGGNAMRRPVFARYGWPNEKQGRISIKTGVRPQLFSHRQVTVRGFQQQVIVIAHKTVGVTPPVIALAQFTQQFQERLEVFGIRVDTPPGILSRRAAGVTIFLPRAPSTRPGPAWHQPGVA